MVNSADYAGHMDVLGSIPEAYRKAFYEQCDTMEYQRGQALWHQGDSAESVGFLISGKAVSTYLSPAGKTGITGLWSDGDMLGAADLGGFSTRQMTVRFLEASTISTMSIVRFYDTLERFPEMGRQVVRALSVRLRWVAHLALTLETQSAEGRIRSVLIILAEHFGVTIEKGQRIDLKLTNEELGAMVGVSRQMTNGVLNKLKNSGCITLEKRWITVIDFDALQPS
jgi:CRP/FNR family transcriptional regulator, cyclic AMP receptor protein